ncbi:MAG: 3-dehydroquinate synthase [Muribaculaceae bacterium]|nr:3-dehydroquinate synthase [Muribaculaceae bacterium]
MTQGITYNNRVGEALDSVLAGIDHTRLVVIADENTAQLVVPRLGSTTLAQAPVITIAAGEENKNLDTLAQVWRQLGELGATRNSMVVNVGGGMVTDLGGFAAATFKRGMGFINCPTSLLAAVDASVGGKTGIDFNGLKNEVGVFAMPRHTIISSCFLDSLPKPEIKAGYAEMLKHAMLHSHELFTQLLHADFDAAFNTLEFLKLIEQSVAIKQHFVEQDPHDNGARHALNLGHTVAHAFESLALKRGKAIHHGYAVAWGLVAETYLSHKLFAFPSTDLYALATFVLSNYGAFHITCDDYDDLIAFMTHDKKSRNGEINCALLSICGQVHCDATISPDHMKEALDIYRDLMHI